MRIDPNSPVPIYLQIANQIRGAVAAGVFRTDEPLPSQRELALQLVVNPNTVQRAYDELEREGLVSSRKGLGMFVGSNGVAAARRKSSQELTDAFVRVVRLARNAKLGPDEIRSCFESALRASAQDQGNSP